MRRRRRDRARLRSAIAAAGAALLHPRDSWLTREAGLLDGEARKGLSQSACSERERWESERGAARGSSTPPLSARAHLLSAPSLAELTCATAQAVGDHAEVDLTELERRAKDDHARRVLVQLVHALGDNDRSDAGEVTLAELLKLSDSDLRYVLEAIAFRRELWPVSADYRWLKTARALQRGTAGPGWWECS